MDGMDGVDWPAWAWGNVDVRFYDNGHLGSYNFALVSIKPGSRTCMPGLLGTTAAAKGMDLELTETLGQFLA